MTREEAVKVIENMTFMCDDTDYDVMSDAVDMAIEALKEQKWIPCSERLPEENGEYLVTVKKGYRELGIWVGIENNWSEVIAWMPLPEPYKAESEDKE